jgi:sucrose phosphorylase
VQQFPEPSDVAELPVGDLPGDQIRIGQEHLSKARVIFPKLMDLLASVLAAQGRAVVSVFGGSGVGKSEVGALLAHGLNASGIDTYLLSGDNYPRRIPQANDAERLRIFRAGGSRGLSDTFNGAELSRLQSSGADCDPTRLGDYPWLQGYQDAGRRALASYLGGDAEIDFAELNEVLAEFHAGAVELRLKRMGRTPGQRWHDRVACAQTKVIIVEWTHGGSPFLHGVDISILLHSTPAETLQHRRLRARDAAVDSPFTAMVLALEERQLLDAARRASLIVARNGDLLSPFDFPLELPDSGPMLNLYPDSLGGGLAEVAGFVEGPEVAAAFDSAYLLPTVFHSDLDRGFSVIDYGLNADLVDESALARVAAAGLFLKLDLVLNHASMQSPQFRDLLEHGRDSRYRDFFIDWNKFWEGCGELTEAGYIQPDESSLGEMFFRKPGLPVLPVDFEDGTRRCYWNTFYQQVIVEAGRPRYRGQLDLNINSGLVWDFYADVLDLLAGYGARIVRLDAFAYADKRPGARNFLNEPGTWELLAKVKRLADVRGLIVLPEVHATYASGTHRKLGKLGYLTYDFFLPGLLLDAVESADATALKRWITELAEHHLATVNMLGCHDGIPLLDLRGLLAEERIESLITTVVDRGGRVKDIHAANDVYYQVNATYFSALGESTAKLLLARAIQLFVPGKPQIWYLDLFAGSNDYDAVARAGVGGHKEINRTNLTAAEVASGLRQPVVRAQLELLRLRNEFPAFGFGAQCIVGETSPQRLVITWCGQGATARLDADLAAVRFTIETVDVDGQIRYYK